MTSVIDVGCGDLIFWKLPLNRMRKCEKYIGIDLSDIIIKRNRKKYPNRKFINASADENLDVKGNIVLCMDLLFHIMDDERFEKILENLCRYSNKLIFINTWMNNPLRDKTDGKYQYYRLLRNYLHIFTKKGFNLTNFHKCPYDEFSAIYVFTKVT
jgi:ubiquinone/menaquinone biosynthesis C-methylase UbiE